MIFLSCSLSFINSLIDLGNSTTSQSDVSFTLNIDASNITAGNLDEMHLIVWKDTNGNDLCDGSENAYSTRPNSACPVFKNSYFCEFRYASEDNSFGDSDGYKKGWNVYEGQFVYNQITNTNKSFDNADINDRNYTW